MTKATVYNQTGEKTQDLDLNPKIFGLERIDANLVHSAVRAQRNNKRHAIAHTKNRGEVAGSGKKPWKQKGTGRARAGSVRSPIWRHGGITFGPRSNRNWSVKLNRNAFRQALFNVLTDKVNDSKLVIVENLDKVSKTKELAAKLSNLATKAGLGKKYVLILHTQNKELERSAKNLQNVKILYANQLNIIDLLQHDTLITKESLPIIEKTYLK
ncbi:MAG: 50S ribosomal protein L4 [Candidatus Doudnabacteria bacterium]|nr:50S ribosomal protein L4 [Candidatus Doudnabacteria bacterium]